MAVAETKSRPLWRGVGSSQSVRPAVDLKGLFASLANDRVKGSWAAVVPDVQQATSQPHRLLVVSPLPAQCDVAGGAQARVFFRRPNDPTQRLGHAKPTPWAHASRPAGTTPLPRSHREFACSTSPTHTPIF